MAPPSELVCGTTRVPDPSGDPAAVAFAATFLEELGVPRRPRFTPSQLAQDVGGSTRRWQQLCELGEIGAVRLPGGWAVTWAELVRFIAARQNLFSMN